MFNKKWKQLMNYLSGDREKCNDPELSTLLSMADKIKASAELNHREARPGFQQALLQRVRLERAAKAPTMANYFSRWQALLKPKFWVPASVSVLLIVLILVGSYALPLLQPQGNMFAGFSKLMISTVNAQDNFFLEPADADSLGVAANSIYILKSKEKVDTALVKKNLRLIPEVGYKLETISDTEWKIILDKPLPPNTLLKISLSTSYLDENGAQQERDYAWAYQVKDTFKVLYTTPRHTSSGVEPSTGIEIAFSHDNYLDFEKYFNISPQVSGKFEKHGRTLVFVPQNPLAYKTIYTVTLKKGLPLDKANEALADDYVFSFETSEQPRDYNNPQLYFYKRFYEVSSKEVPLVQLSTYGMPQGEINVEVFRFKDANGYLRAKQEMDKLPYWSSSRKDYRVDIKGLVNFLTFPAIIKVEENVNYIEFPQSLDRGFYVANFLYNGKISQIYLQVSDLATYVNITQTDTAVWVNNLVTGAPEPDVDIAFVDKAGTYSTNGQGLAVFPTPDNFYPEISKKDRDKTDVYLKVSKNDDQIILDANNLLNFKKGERSADDYWKYLYTDRPLYQPTDVIKYWGLLKDRQGDAVNKKMSITLYKDGYVDYYYQPIKIVDQEVELSDLGTFKGEMKLENLRPDYYNLQIKLGDLIIANKYISIDKYTKPAYELTLESDKDLAYANEEIKFKAKAQFFEGTPLPNLELQANTPDKNDTLLTNDNGEISFSFKEKANPCQYDYGRCWPKYENISVYPLQSETAQIAAEKQVKIFGPNVYLTSDVTYPEKGQAKIVWQSKFIDFKTLQSLNWWDVDMGKQIAPQTKLQVQVKKITYNRIETGTHYDFIYKHTYKTYRYEEKEEIVDNLAVQTDNGGTYVYERPVEPGASYQVKVKYFGTNGYFDQDTSYLYYYDGLLLSRYNNNDYHYYRLQVGKENSAETYDVGQTVKTKLLDNDALLPSGEDKFLFLQMQNGLQEFQVSSQPFYDFVFEPRDIPNVNVTAVHFNGHNYDVVDSGYDSAVVSYDFNQRNLKINFKTDKPKYQPGEQVKLSVLVTDKNDNPIEAEVNLNLVDEAFYAVQNDQANPLESLYTRVYSGSLASIQTHRSVQEMFGGAEKGGCFLAGTLISLADGSKKPIEKIAVGDEVQTFSNPVIHELVSGKVSEVYVHTVPFYLIINDQLRVTPQHLVFSAGSFVEAGSLKVGDYLLNEHNQRVRVDKLEKVDEMVKVYNFRTDPQHTYFANGFYVHNEKGGGPREFFTDAALFSVLKTNGAGEGEVVFKLPDNITSWRVTAQALSEELFGGVNTVKIPVSLPVFADINLGSDYLLADKPIVKARAYGTALQKNDQVKFIFSAVNWPQTEQLSSAFSPVYFVLPELKLGKTDLLFSLQSGKGNDAIKLPINVVKSHLQVATAEQAVLTPGYKINLSGQDPVTVVLSDKGQNQLYGPLENLSWSWSDRVDELLAKSEARKLLKQYYNEEVVNFQVPALNYQINNGGITLLPYSGDDLELSARVAQLGVQGFDRESLSQYLFGKLESPTANREEVSLALYGLAELQKPILPRLNVWLSARQDLTVIEKLYLAQGLADLGDKERARQMLTDILGQYGQTKEDIIIVKVSDNPDEIFKATALSAVLSATLNLPEHAGLWNYLEHGQKLWGKNKNSETLFVLEKIDYIRRILPQLHPSPAEVKYTLVGHQEKVELTGNGAHSFEIYPSQISGLSFDSVKGQVGISIISLKPFTSANVNRSNDIGIERKYLVKGKQIDKLKDGDLVEVVLTPRFNDSGLNPLANEFQVTDILPAGLTPLTKLEGRYAENTNNYCYTYPYQVNGQEVKFMFYRNWNWCRNRQLHYFAQVKTLGEYYAEPALIQSYLYPEIVNYSNFETIKIEK